MVSDGHIAFIRNNLEEGLEIMVHKIELGMMMKNPKIEFELECDGKCLG